MISTWMIVFYTLIPATYLTAAVIQLVAPKTMTGKVAAAFWRDIPMHLFGGVTLACVSPIIGALFWYALVVISGCAAYNNLSAMKVCLGGTFDAAPRMVMANVTSDSDDSADGPSARAPMEASPNLRDTGVGGMGSDTLGQFGSSTFSHDLF